MGEFLDAALGFPAVLFSFVLMVVAGYWVLVLFGALGTDALDVDADAGAGDGGEGGGLGDLMAWAGLGGVPVTVALSLLVALAWFLSLVGQVLVGVAHAWVTVPVLVAAVAGAWLVTRALVRPLRRVFPADVAPSRRDFVGRLCVVRTGRVTAGFGQAEVTAADGSTAVVQIRVPDGDAVALLSGATALIFDYDAIGEVFLVMPYDTALDPGR
ncbi:OB-fold-containig protein [Actinomadura kijaniata]|uniref:OB-fold-containig protein n=1 Tax=Actinomadura kijaniata TaxID=46161 RepID=UPI000835F6CA|nr:OB-fold-containig protein [Actinomadura kijaniata]